MSRSESVPTSRRLRLRDRRPPITTDSVALDELAECLGGDAEDTDRVDAVELAFESADTDEALSALQRLVDTDYDVTVRELVVEIRR